MTPMQLMAYTEAVRVLMAFGEVAAADIRQMFGASPTLTDVELNGILATVEGDDGRRAALARADAGEATGAPLTKS